MKFLFLITLLTITSCVTPGHGVKIASRAPASCKLLGRVRTDTRFRVGNMGMFQNRVHEAGGNLGVVENEDGRGHKVGKAYDCPGLKTKESK